jgi:hypothetical protein
MQRAGVLLAALALIGTAAPEPAHAAAAPRAYTVAQELTLDPGQDASFSLACRAGDLATDGTWRASAFGLNVLEADSISRQGYRFVVSNDSAAPASLRLAVVCLHADGARLSGPLRTSSVTSGVGAASAPALRCPAGTAAVAAGFRIEGGIARVTNRFPRGLRTAVLGFAAVDDVRVTASTRCLRAGSGVRLAFRSGATDVAAGRVESFTVRCHRGETAIAGAYRLSRAWYLGQTPGGRRRSFRLQAASTTAGGTARLGLLCLR